MIVNRPSVTSQPTRKQVEWQAEAYKILDSLPYSAGDPHFTLTEDDTGAADLRISVELWGLHAPAGRWSGTINDLRNFARVIVRVEG